jgi:hypothetical protein
MSGNLTEMLNLLQIASGSPDNIIAQQALKEGVQKIMPGSRDFLKAVAGSAPLIV